MIAARGIVEEFTKEVARASRTTMVKVAGALEAAITTEKAKAQGKASQAISKAKASVSKDKAREKASTAQRTPRVKVAVSKEKVLGAKDKGSMLARL